MPVVVGPIDGLSVGPVPVRSARALFTAVGSFIKLDAEWTPVLGRLPVGPYLLAIHGPPGAGKTTTALRLAGALAEAGQGPVLFDSLEEGLDSPALGAVLRRLELLREDVLLTSTASIVAIFELVRAHGARTVIFDSLSMTGLSGEDLARLSREARVSVIYTLQATKSGDARGSLELLHVADVVLRIERGGRFDLEKSRYSARLQGTLPWMAGEEEVSHGNSNAI